MIADYGIREYMAVSCKHMGKSALVDAYSKFIYNCSIIPMTE